VCNKQEGDLVPVKKRKVRGKFILEAV
jgi:hypothetical protein